MMIEKSSDVAAKRQKSVIGKVISDKMHKTIVVQIENKKKHPLYGKYIKTYTKFYAHDEENSCKTGDMVTIVQTRPLSKTKRWKLVNIVNKEPVLE